MAVGIKALAYILFQILEGVIIAMGSLNNFKSGLRDFSELPFGEIITTEKNTMNLELKDEHNHISGVLRSGFF